MIYIAKVNSNRVVEDFRQEPDDSYKLASNEISLTRRMYIILSSAFFDNRSLIIKVKEKYNKVSSLNELYLKDGENDAIIPIYLCGYQDSGVMLRIVDIREVDNRESYNESLFIPITHAVYDALNNYRDVIRLGTVFSLKTEGIISIDDLKIINKNHVAEPLAKTTITSENYKSVLELKAKDLLVSRLNIDILINFYRFILLNNKLANSKIFVTFDNIDTVLKEVSSKDEHMGKIVAQCKEVMKIMQKYDNTYGLYSTFIRTIKNMTSIEEMDVVYNEYLRKFQG